MATSHYLPVANAAPEVRDTIESFRRPGDTVAKMMADGFTHVTGTCTNCRQIVMKPFRMMLRGEIDQAQGYLGAAQRRNLFSPLK